MAKRIGAAIFAVLALAFTSSARSFAEAPRGPAPADDPSFEYRLGAGDKLRIIVFGEESLTGEFFVSGAGKISFPPIGDIDALGKTIPDLQRSIEANLADGYLKQPKVSAEALNYRPFYILGEVMNPGEYPYGDAGYYYRAYRKYYDQ